MLPLGNCDFIQKIETLIRIYEIYNTHNTNENYNTFKFIKWGILT